MFKKSNALMRQKTALRNHISMNGGGWIGEREEYC